MADEKILATLKAIITADKRPLKKALDGAKRDTEKSTSQIQGMLQKIRKTMSSVSLKGTVKVPTKEFQDIEQSIEKIQEKIKFLEAEEKALYDLGENNGMSEKYRKLNKNVEEAGRALDRLLEKQKILEASGKASEYTPQFSNLKNSLDAEEKKLEGLRSEWLERKDKNLPLNYVTDDGTLRNLETDIKETLGKITELGSKMGELEEKGKMKQPTEAARKLAEQIENVSDKIGKYKTEMAGLTSGGLDSGTDAFVKNQTEIQKCESELERLTVMKENLAKTGENSKGWGGFTKILGGVRSALSKVSTVIKRTSGLFGALIQKFTSGIPILNRFTGGVKDNGSSFGGGLKNLLKYSLGIRSLFALANKLRSALVDGFKNLSQYSGNTNNSISMLMSSLTQLKNAFAAAFAPVLNIVAPILNAVIQKIISVVNAIGQLTSALTGAGTFIKAKQLNQNYAASLDKNTKSANKANDANQKLQRTILGFDQINKLDDTSGSSSSDSAATGGLTGKDMFETLNISNEMRAIAAQIKEAWKNADFTEIGRIVGRKLNSALQNIPWGSIQSTCNRIAKSTATFLNGFIEETDWQLVGNTLSQGINTAFGTANTFAENFHWGSLGNAVGNGINGALGGLDWSQINTTVYNIAKGLTDGLNSFIQTTDWSLLGQAYANKLNTVWSFYHTSISNFDWKGAGNALAQFISEALETVDTGKLGAIVSERIKGIFDYGIGFIEGLDWFSMGETVYTKVKDFLTNIDWNGIADRTFELIGAAFGGLAAFICGVFKTAIDDAKQFISDHFCEAGKFTWDGFKKGIKDAIKGLGSWIKEHIFNPFIKGFKNAFGIHSPSTVMAKQGSYIISGLLKGLKDNIDSVLTWIGKIPGRVKDKLSDAKTWLLETGGNVLTGFKNGLDDRWNSIGDWFRDLPNKISSAIPNLFDTGKNAIQNFANGFGSVHIPLPHVSVSWNKCKVGPMSFSTPKFALNWYAKGGFPENGEMFMARESGPELVGKMGNKNTVANNNQIIEGIRTGVFEAVVDALNASGLLDKEDSEKDVVLEFTLKADSETVYKFVRKGRKKYENRYMVADTI